MAPANRLPVSDMRKFAVAGLIIVGVFLLCCGTGMSSVAVGSIGVILALGGPILIFATTLRGNARSYVFGTARVVEISPQPTIGPTGRGEMGLVVNARGIDGVAIRIRDPAIPINKWPHVGATLPVRSVSGSPRKTIVLWADVRTHEEAVYDDRLNPEYADLSDEERGQDPDEDGEFDHGPLPPDDTPTMTDIPPVPASAPPSSDGSGDGGHGTSERGSAVAVVERPTEQSRRRPSPRPRRPLAEEPESALASVAAPEAVAAATEVTTETTGETEPDAEPAPEVIREEPAAEVIGEDLEADVIGEDVEAEVIDEEEPEVTEEEPEAVLEAEPETVADGPEAEAEPEAALETETEPETEFQAAPEADETEETRAEDVVVDEEEPEAAAEEDEDVAWAELARQPDEAQPDEAQPDEAQPDEIQPDEIQPHATEADEIQPDETQPHAPEDDDVDDVAWAELARQEEELDQVDVLLPQPSVIGPGDVEREIIAPNPYITELYIPPQEPRPVAPAVALEHRIPGPRHRAPEEEIVDATDPADELEEELPLGAVAEFLPATPQRRLVPLEGVNGVSVTLIVSDLQRSLRFYRETLGLSEVDSNGSSAVLATGDARVLLRRSADMPPVDRRVVHLNLEVPDVYEAYERLRADGVEFVHRPRVVPQGEQLDLCTATFRDPDGHAIALTRWEIRR